MPRVSIAIPSQRRLTEPQETSYTMPRLKRGAHQPSQAQVCPTALGSATRHAAVQGIGVWAASFQGAPCRLRSGELSALGGWAGDLAGCTPITAGGAFSNEALPVLPGRHGPDWAGRRLPFFGPLACRDGCTGEALPVGALGRGDGARRGLSRPRRGLRPLDPRRLLPK